MSNETRQHYGYATTGKPTQNPGGGAVPPVRSSDNGKASPPPKEKK